MKKKEKPCLVFSISMHPLQHVNVWQMSPKLSAGPMCFWHGVVIPVPHHVVSSPVNLIRCHTKVIILWSNKWQCWCISLTLFRALPPFVSFMLLSVPPHVLSWGVSATITGVMTKGNMCGRIGSILYRRLQSFHQLTARPAGETGGVVRGMLHMCVLLAVYLLWGGFKIKNQVARKDNWGGGGEFCFPLLSHNDAILSYETLLGW